MTIAKAYVVGVPVAYFAAIAALRWHYGPDRVFHILTAAGIAVSIVCWNL